MLFGDKKKYHPLGTLDNGITTPVANANRVFLLNFPAP
jgi:hypothetical protein